jgi:hypothetical protein
MQTLIRTPARPTRPLQRDDRPVRRALLAQVARLEAELSGLWCSAWPRTDLPQDPATPRGGGRLLSVAELEELRDELAGRVARARTALAERAEGEERDRRLIEEMLLEPERFKFVRVSHADIGEPGCKHWHVRPAWGLLGMFLNWWRVRISSGCPLARAG